MNVEVRHLRALVTLADSDTFTTAAAVLGTTQPTLSRTITQLEETLGVRLVERTTREMSFTPDGLRFAEDAQGILARLDAAVVGLHAASPGPLRLGWTWASLGRHTVPLLNEWKQEHAELIEFSRPDDPVEALENREIDMAVVRRSPPGSRPLAGFETRTLLAERLVAALAVDDPRARQDAVTLAQLAASPVAVCATAPTVTGELWRSTGRTPATVTVANTDEWLTRIAVGEAVGVTTEATTHGHRVPEVNYVPIEDAPRVDVILAWPAENPHPQAAVFADFAHDYFARLIEASAPPLVLVAEPDHPAP